MRALPQTPARVPRRRLVAVGRVAAVCGPVAHEASRLRDPLVLRPDVEAVADACHELMH